MKIPIPYRISNESLNGSVKKAEESLHTLTKTVLEGIKPPSGAYAFFNHGGHALSRVQDIGKIINRLHREVSVMALLHVEEERKMPKNWPSGKPYPEDIQEIMKKSHEANGLAQLDMESLYVFGQILLDQWSLLVIAIGNIPLPKVHPFSELVNYFQDNPKNDLYEIWDTYSSQILWLYYQVRFYRNRFVVHSNRPWQRGVTRTSLGEEFSLFIPTPPGWLDDKALDDEIRKLLPLTPSRIKDAADDYLEKERPGRIIEVLFEDIGNIKDKNDREKIAELFGKKGGSTPTFQTAAQNLLEFFSSSMELLNKIASSNLARIDLGKPNKTSEEMWKERD